MAGWFEGFEERYEQKVKSAPLNTCGISVILRDWLKIPVSLFCIELFLCPSVSLISYSKLRVKR